MRSYNILSGEGYLIYIEIIEKDDYIEENKALR